MMLWFTFNFVSNPPAATRTCDVCRWSFPLVSAALVHSATWHPRDTFNIVIKTSIMTKNVVVFGRSKLRWSLTMNDLSVTSKTSDELLGLKITSMWPYKYCSLWSQETAVALCVLQCILASKINIIWSLSTPCSFGGLASN